MGAGFIVEYQTPNGDWSLAYAGRKWKTEAGANKAATKWLADQEEFSWRPSVRVIPLEKSYNVRGVCSLVVPS